ncbi:MAG: hypothetical protein FVQ82_13240 [Planctomycetes bacterium]|nr:hypothetical protein [Planctomycetota bacterium]
MLKCTVVLSTLLLLMVSTAANGEYEYYKGSQFPGKGLRKDVEIRTVVTEGGKPTEYKRREVKFFPRKGVDSIPVVDGMIKRNWTLTDLFAPIIVDFGQLNLQRATITHGPKVVEMKQGGKPGKQWNVSLGISKFRVTLEDGAKTTIKDAIALAEKMPVRYRRALIIASGNEVDDDAMKDRRRVKKEAIEKANAAKADREGLAFYASIKSPTCTGDSMTLPDGTTPELLARAAGLLLASRLQETEADLFDRWAKAAKADGIRVSKKVGPAKNPKADIVDFAGLYAHAIDHIMGRGQHGQIQKVSPERCKLWRHVLEKTGTKRLYLSAEYNPLGGELRDGLGNSDGAKAKITSKKPESVSIRQFDYVKKKVVHIPVKRWEGIIGNTKFKVSLEDVEMDLGLDDAKRLIESLPPPMRGGLTAISEEGEFGLTLYKGGVAYGVPDRIGMGGHNLSTLTFAHECGGHSVDQLTNQRDKNIRNRWGTARLIDDVRVTGYGDGPIHEDQACFARIYGVAYAYDNTAEKDRVTTKAKLDCPEISKTGYMNHLRKLSPARFAVYEQMLVITGGMKEKDKAPSPDIDIDAIRKKSSELHKKMQPATKKVQDTVKGIVEAKKGVEAKT